MTISREAEKRFGEIFEIYLHKKLTELGEEYIKTERFLKHSAEETRIYSSLESMMTEAMKELLAQYRDILCDIMVEQQDYFYK